MPLSCRYLLHCVRRSRGAFGGIPRTTSPPALLVVGQAKGSCQLQHDVRSRGIPLFKRVSIDHLGNGSSILCRQITAPCGQIVQRGLSKIG